MVSAYYMSIWNNWKDLLQEFLFLIQGFNGRSEISN
ncbi:hypothetical protein C5167_044503 [Papaver somniferum]|uniref:Uncharacterized protein n=1 Tax=Papaver somniferum TaxID=3469 RepID=A0A4Y7L8W0_PAPSO|nr:hypothetical protein C5167_044503 [Papaver somniferum]